MKFNQIALLLSLTVSYCAFAEKPTQDFSDLQNCLLQKVQNEHNGQKTVAKIKAECDELLYPKDIELGRISQRIIREKLTEADPFVITPHKMNYIAPLSWTSNINKQAYAAFGNPLTENLADMEAKFQLSIKAPLASNLLTQYDALYFGFTTQSWWQVYSNNISKPFRETNYQPEIFYVTPLDYHPWGSNTGLAIGFEHQSNGQSQILSRSWNRIYANLLFEKSDFALALRPWWRIPEDEKHFAYDPEGDDNPDIADYMGHFELMWAQKWDHITMSSMFRQSFSKSRGAIELGFTFPLLWSDKLRGYVQYFNGYGESLIDYNHHQQRLSIGIALTDNL